MYSNLSRKMYALSRNFRPKTVSSLPGTLIVDWSQFPFRACPFPAFNSNSNSHTHQFVYRLSACPELSLGLFSTADTSTPVSSASTYPSARAPDSASPTRKGVLIAHVIATKCPSHFVTDECMDLPEDSQSGPALADTGGHHENGRTIAVHSLAVLPAYQGRGLGKTVMKSYIQRMETSGIADRMSLLAHDGLIKFYEGLGFENRGASEVKWGGGGWTNMVTFTFYIAFCSCFMINISDSRDCRFMILPKIHWELHLGNSLMESYSNCLYIGIYCVLVSQSWAGALHPLLRYNLQCRILHIVMVSRRNFESLLRFHTCTSRNAADYSSYKEKRHASMYPISQALVP